MGYAPDGLGRPTQAGTFASNVTYYPNGAMSGFTYGNGIVHSMTQNARQLPARSLDSYVNGGITTKVLDDSFTYDANGNVLSLTDVSNAPSTDNRSWGTNNPSVYPGIVTQYDGLDRLLKVYNANWGSTTGGYNAIYTYDPLDNLRSNRLGAGLLTYGYDAGNRLATLTYGTGSAQPVTTDIRGNITANAYRGQAYEFDLAHRMNAVTGKESYLYDGNGRRVRTVNQQTGTIEYFGYGKDGRLLQDWSNRRQVRNGYIYLGNTVVGLYEVNITNGTITPKYQHTDALGSPVVTTNASKTVLSRMSYTPYGVPAMPMDGVGYTGHFMDVGTQLTYMQQRYYDPQMGRFMSPDPIRTNPANGVGFNRFWYANANPLKYIDPDGRYVCNAKPTDCSKVDAWVKAAKTALGKLDSNSRAYKRLDAVLDKLGDAWQKNGVTVMSATLKPGTLGDANFKTGVIRIDFNQSKAWAAAVSSASGASPRRAEDATGASTLTHEGSHLVYNPSGNFTPKRSELLMGEIRAYGVGSTVSNALGVDEGLHTTKDFMDAANASVKSSCPGTGTYCQ